jgi:apolipoprotein D and lipocalin family protein
VEAFGDAFSDTGSGSGDENRFVLHDVESRETCAGGRGDRIFPPTLPCTQILRASRIRHVKTLLFFVLGAAAISGLLAACATRSARTLPTVTRVDLSRYAGKWYEVGRLPNAFQRDDSNATAEYTALGNGKIRVVNTEYRPNGSTRVAEGTAQPVPDGTDSRLRVRFGGLASLVPVPKYGNYWIVRLEPDYSMAMVGTPDRKYLWILARQPCPPRGVMSKYLQAAEVLGFDVTKLRRATWDCGPKKLGRPSSRSTSSS